MANVGDRVFAIRNSTETEVFIYGFGVYNGNQKLPRKSGRRVCPTPKSFSITGVWFGASNAGGVPRPHSSRDMANIPRWRSPREALHGQPQRPLSTLWAWG